MSTNYYIRTKQCACCGRFDLVHIGTKAGGEFFFFSPNPQVSSWKDWRQAIEEKGFVVYDEYDRDVSLEKFEIIVEKAPNRGDQYWIDKKSYPKECWLDSEGYSFSSREFS